MVQLVPWKPKLTKPELWKLKFNDQIQVLGWKIGLSKTLNRNISNPKTPNPYHQIHPRPLSRNSNPCPKSLARKANLQPLKYHFKQAGEKIRSNQGKIL